MEMCYIKDLSSKTAQFNFTRRKFSVKREQDERQRERDTRTHMATYWPPTVYSFH